MKKKVRHYEFEGVVLDIPLYYDELADMYIEEYRNFNEKPVWTKEGCPVTGAVEEACLYGEWEERQRCNECGSCLFYTPAVPHGLIGVCRNRRRLWAGKGTGK